MNDILVPIITSLIATGIGALAGWILNQRRHINKINNDIESLSNGVENINGKMANRFDEMANRFDKMTNRFDQVDFEFSRLTDEQKGLDKRVEGMKSEFTSSLLGTVANVIRDDENKKENAQGRASELIRFPDL